MTHPNLATAAVAAAAVGGVVMLTRARVRYWRGWGMRVFDHFADTLTDRLDVTPDLDGLTDA